MENTLCSILSPKDAPKRLIETDLSALLARAAQFISGAAAPYPVVTTLATLCREAEPSVQPVCERIAADLLKVLDEEHDRAHAAGLLSLGRRPFRQLFPKAEEQLKDPDLEKIHIRFARVWKHLTDQREREFAQRCAIIMVEAVRLHRLAGDRPLARLN